MKLPTRYCLLVVSAVLCGPGPGVADDLDAALRGGDKNKVLELLSPDEVEETEAPAQEPAAVVKPIPETGKSDGRTSQRITLRTADGSEKMIEGSQRNLPLGAMGSEGEMMSVPTADGQPRKAVPIRHPAEVPLTRPRVTYASTVNMDSDAGNTNRSEDVSPPIGEMGRETATGNSAAEAPEDRNLAAAELVKLLKDMNMPGPPAEVPVQDTGLEEKTPPDEDQARSKPLAMEGEPAASVSTIPVGSVTGPPATTVGTSPADIVQQTRRNLEGLLREAKSDAFGGGTVSAPVRPGAIPDGGWRYNGQWREGHMDGFGTLAYPDGWTYEGEWQEGRIIGTGTLTHPDGWQYTGEWRDGRMDGEGVLTYPDGWRYVGEWRDGKMHGKGELIHPEGWQ